MRQVDDALGVARLTQIVGHAGTRRPRPIDARTPFASIGAMTDSVRRLVDIATGQHGAIAPHQAHLVGLSTRQLRSRVQSGILQPAGTHVLRSPFLEVTPLADLAAFVLDCEGAPSSIWPRRCRRPN